MRQLRRSDPTQRPRLPRVWSRRTHRLGEQDIYDGLDLPDDEETQKRDTRSRQKRQTNRWFWLYVAIVLLLLLTLAALGLR